jgi:hypothetical protein
MTDAATARLTRIGDALQRAAEADLLASATPAAHRPRRSRRLLLGIAAAAVVIPGGAIAATQLIGADDVARSIPAGTLSLAGTEPTCTVVRANVEYHCTLAHPPAPEVSDWKGTVEPTVGADKRVNGGCRSLATDGRTWQCYLGREAVAQQIIGPDFLGERAPSPGVG